MKSNYAKETSFNMNKKIKNILYEHFIDPMEWQSKTTHGREA
jgi:hypothetical protein